MLCIWVFPKIMVPQNGWFIRENPIEMDDLGVYPYFWKHPYILYIYILWGKGKGKGKAKDGEDRQAARRLRQYVSVFPMGYRKLDGQKVYTTTNREQWVIWRHATCIVICLHSIFVTSCSFQTIHVWYNCILLIHIHTVTYMHVPSPNFKSRLMLDKTRLYTPEIYHSPWK